VGKGYGGGGLSFLHSNLYYLTGVSSVKDPDSNNSIVVFTEVEFHMQWIRGLYNRYRRQAISSCSKYVTLIKINIMLLYVIKLLMVGSY